MDYLDENKRVVHVEESWRTFTVYGNFEEPTKKTNFIVVRIPEKGAQWSKKIVPAINRLVRSWFRKEDLRGRNGYPREAYWNVDGEPTYLTKDSRRIWDTDKALRFEWDGEKLVEAS